MPCASPRRALTSARNEATRNTSNGRDRRPLSWAKRTSECRFTRERERPEVAAPGRLVLEWASFERHRSILVLSAPYVAGFFTCPFHGERRIR